MTSMIRRRSGGPDDREGCSTWPALTLWSAVGLSGLLTLSVLGALAFIPFLPSGDAVAFVSGQESGQIRLIDVDRGLEVTLLPLEHTSNYPVMWTPDGRRLVFTTYWNGEPHIATFDIGSGSVEVLAVDAAGDVPTWNPSLSPDGEYVAFVSYRPTGRRALYVAETGDRRSTRRLADVDAASLSWSPDGRQLAFVAPVVGSAGSSLFVVNVDRPDVPRRVVSGLGIVLSWSPDSSLIAFQSSHTGSYKIYVVDSESGVVRNLTGSDSAQDIDPVWSPDGAQIAFYSDRDGDFEIYLMNRDGSHLRALTHNTYIDLDPVWSPDGRQIAFVAYPEGQSEIYVVDTDGSDLRRLTDNSFEDQFPVWWPD